MTSRQALSCVTQLLLDMGQYRRYVYQVFVRPAEYMGMYLSVVDSQSWAEYAEHGRN